MRIDIYRIIMSKKTNTETESKRPITVEDYKELDRKNIEILDSDAESNGETVVIALVDFDEFANINKDFGRDEGDRVLIETGRYIREKTPKDAGVYRMGGDEFGIIFKGTMEREDIGEAILLREALDMLLKKYDI